MASHGSSNESLVAMQNIVVRLDTNADIALGQEPEVDIEDDKVSLNLQQETPKVSSMLIAMEFHSWEDI